MKLCYGIFASFFLLLTVKTQRIRYASRFRNFTVVSDTGSAYLINMTIFQHGMDHRMAAFFETTKDIHAKNIQVVTYRCIFEKSACEYFQTWKFSENLKEVVYMKNQIWTPLFSSVNPKLDFPIVKKGIYSTTNSYFNTEAIVLFYPEATKYYWKADAIMHELNNKRAVVLRFDFAIVEFAERNRKRERGNTTYNS